MPLLVHYSLFCQFFVVEEVQGLAAGYAGYDIPGAKA